MGFIEFSVGSHLLELGNDAPEAQTQPGNEDIEFCQCRNVREFSVCDSREMDLNSKYSQHSPFCHLGHCFKGFTSNGKLDFLCFNQRIN